jgi:hypothetical protein
MKKLAWLLIVSLFSGACAKAENKSAEAVSLRGNLDGFLDIKWGESMKNAANILDEKGYIYIPRDDIIAAIGKFADQDVELALDFFEDQFYSGSITFRSKKSESDYDEYVSIVTERYGNPSNVSTNIFPMTTWEFDNNCYIDVFLLSRLHISYTEKELRDRQSEKEREQKERESQVIKNKFIGFN